MPHPRHTRMGRLALGLLAASGLALPTLPALADGNGRMVPLTPKYKEECSACHVAYPPSLMPAASWNRRMSPWRVSSASVAAKTRMSRLSPRYAQFPWNASVSRRFPE